METITTLAENTRAKHQKDWYTFLFVQKHFVEKHFNWLKVILDKKNKQLIGTGILQIGGKSYKILLSYSPFEKFRYDRIYIQDDSIKYHDDIHLYYDNSLCLYHPVFDKLSNKNISLCEMIPWISEWLVHYNQWKKYRVWLGKEIKH
ncbi:hypothetical protein [Sphingobacterium sp. SYP-B4668]|uniref:hypothetical protein n=1 Tax=Sphingobacterium sp. SYP-B4668 TaxID=2996035 RepID=UPI0022DE579E|nr:hypothetical protein [Sphingobacterium sp. SYP-B4668]